MCREHGIEKILFGTDTPWANQSKEVKAIADLSFSEEEKDKILSKNARDLLSEVE